MLQLNVAVEGFLICLFTVYQEVSSFKDCAYYECIGDTCTCKARPKEESSSWLVPVIVILGIVGCSCFITLCTGCCRFCKERESEVIIHREEPTVRVSVRPSAFAPPVPSTPTINQFAEPPPYAEIAWKPYYYPPPLDQPPAYDNIAMEGHPPLDASQPPGSAPKDNS